MLIFFVMVVDILLVFLSFALGKELVKHARLKSQLKEPVVSVDNAQAVKRKDAIRTSILELISILLFVAFIVYIAGSKTVKELSIEDLLIYGSTLLLCIISTGLSTARKLIFALEPIKLTSSELLYQNKLLSLNALSLEHKDGYITINYCNGKTEENEVLCRIDPKSKNGDAAVKLLKA